MLGLKGGAAQMWAAYMLQGKVAQLGFNVRPPGLTVRLLV
jgi:hypothetical protein